MSPELTNNDENFGQEILDVKENCQLISQKFNQLRNLLVAKLHNCYVEKSNDEPFTDLINAVEEIRAVEVEDIDNVRPPTMPQLNSNTFTDFHFSLYSRIVYYMKTLRYFLLLKGVPKYKVDAQKTLKGLIELIDFIDVIKPSVLTVQPVDEIQYYGSNIIIGYTLKDIDGTDITTGDITIRDSNGVVYDSIEAGKPISISPLSISSKVNGEYQYETFTIIYNGTEKYEPSNTQTIRVKILPARIKMIVNITNITTKSRYYNSHNTGYESDEWNISISTFNHQNQPLDNIPVIITSSISNEEQEIHTDAEGNYSFTQSFNQPGNCLINFATDYEDTDKLSNVTYEHELNIKYNILRQSIREYTDYTGKNNYSFSIDIIDEDTGQLTQAYNRKNIKILLNDTLLDTVSINNAHAQYQFSDLKVGEYQMRWVLSLDNFTTELVTYINILSNFILPEKRNYFLADTTPTIIYKPEGVASDQNHVTATITYMPKDMLQYEMITRVEERYAQDYNDETGEMEDVLDEEGQPVIIYETIEEYKLDENGDPIPIMRDDYPSAQIELDSDESGILSIRSIPSSYTYHDSVGTHNITLYSSNNLNEEVSFDYEITQPFDIERTIYHKSSEVQYRITFYDSEDEYEFNLQKGRDNINPSLYSVTSGTNGGYPAIILTIPISETLIGNNLLNVTQNEYSETHTFTFIAQSFTLLTSSVSIGEDTIQIQSNDPNITSIEIDSPYINEIDTNFKNGIFTIEAEFTKAGNIQFDVIGDDLSTETFTIIVNKLDLTPHLQYGFGVYEPDDDRSVGNNIALIDLDNTDIIFTVDMPVYSDLPITCIIKKGSNQLSTQSAVYSDDDDNFSLTMPTNLVPDTYTINFIYHGDNNYLNFNVSKEFTVLRSIPTHELESQNTTFKDTQFFIYSPKFTQENPANITSRGTNSYSTQVDGVWESIHCYLTDGWYNTGTWECDFDLMTSNSYGIRYIGISLLMSLSPQITGEFDKLIGGWEGSLASDPPGTFIRDNNDTLTLANGSVGYATQINNWIHINMKKTSPTTLIITKTGDTAHNGAVTYEWQELSNYEKLTFGTWNNPYGNDVRGHLKIKNFIVRGVY